MNGYRWPGVAIVLAYASLPHTCGQDRAKSGPLRAQLYERDSVAASAQAGEAGDPKPVVQRGSQAWPGNRAALSRSRYGAQRLGHQLEEVSKRRGVLCGGMFPRKEV